MSDEIESFKDYWKAVQRAAMIQVKETEYWAEDEGEDLTTAEIISSSADYAVDSDNLVMNNPRTIIYFTDNGFGGLGYGRYVRFMEWDNNPRAMIKSLAQAAYYNDIRDVIENIFDFREDLGESQMLLDDVLWSDGVECTYVFEKGHGENIEQFEFTLEHLGEGEWKMFDYQGNHFETISPDVKIENTDSEIPAKTLNIWLDNICYKRIREIESEE